VSGGLGWITWVGAVPPWFPAWG